MTEHEYTIEMLCCLPKELLQLKLKGSNDIPQWMIGIHDNIISEALDEYDTDKYVKLREDMKKLL